MQTREEGGPAKVVVIYEPNAVGDTALIPHEKVDRIPAALAHLEGLLVDYLQLDARLLVSLMGAIEDKGSVAMFGEMPEINHVPYKVFRVVSYDSRTGKFTHASRIERADAEHLYDQRREELS